MHEKEQLFREREITFPMTLNIKCFQTLASTMGGFGSPLEH